MPSIDRRAALKLGALTLLAPGALTQLAGCSQESSSGSTPKSSDEKQAPSSYTIDNIRDYVVGIDEPVKLEDGSTRTQICFDNAATTPALVPVLDEVTSRLLTYGSIGRGTSPNMERRSSSTGLRSWRTAHSP